MNSPCQMLRICACLLALAVMLGIQPASAGENLLVVRNPALPGAEAEFTEADLMAMPQVTIHTHTEFTDGLVEFVGPLARDAVANVPMGDATVAHLVAANDYAFDIPVSDLMEYDVILALSANGRRLSIRDKGPIWLMYPLDDYTELQDPRYNNRLVWQLTTIELR